MVMNDIWLEVGDVFLVVGMEDEIVGFCGNWDVFLLDWLIMEVFCWWYVFCVLVIFGCVVVFVVFGFVLIVFVVVVGIFVMIVFGCFNIC